MGTKGIWSYNEVHGIKPPKLPQKLALVSPKMDIDVTGVSGKNVRTHLIDHPKDEGQKQREQLWSFQQKYRGAIGKLRNLPDIQKSEQKSHELVEDGSGEERQSKASNSNSSNISLQSRFRRRFSNRLRANGTLPSTSSKIQESSMDNLKPKRTSENCEADNGKRPSIHRLYSSGFIVRNSLYQQIRGDEISLARRNQENRDESVLESSDRYGGSLERFPDISGFQQLPNSTRFRKMSISHYSRKYGESIHDKRLMSLRRSLTSLADIGSTCSRRKLLLVSEDGRGKLSGLGCIDSEEENDDDDDDDDDDNIEDDEEHMKSRRRLNQLLTITRESQNDHINDKNTFIVSQNDVRNKLDMSSQKPKIQECDNVSIMHKSSSAGVALVNKRETHGDLGSKVHVLEKEDTPKCCQDQKCGKDTVGQNESNDRCPSSDSLDIPRDRFGCTTHSIDKKLSLRKPWEWRPSPYRWTDKSVKETDKPYIEKILNRGEIIDEYNYDSFARTKPLKLASAPDTGRGGFQR